MFRNIHRKTPVLESLFNNVTDLQGTYFEKHLRMTASGFSCFYQTWMTFQIANKTVEDKS